jgi:hypothetical protein
MSEHVSREVAHMPVYCDLTVLAHCSSHNDLAPLSNIQVGTLNRKGVLDCLYLPVDNCQPRIDVDTV